MYIHPHEYVRPIDHESIAMFENKELPIEVIDRRNVKYDKLPKVDLYFLQVSLEQPTFKKKIVNLHNSIEIIKNLIKLKIINVKKFGF